jgi:hypothetical protein
MNGFLEDSRGNKSSKRLGFIAAVATAVITTLITLAILLNKEEYDLAIKLVEGSWWASFGFIGAVASEFFSKKEK